MDKFSPQELQKFWNIEADKEEAFFDAPSTKYYFRREKELIGRWLGKLKGKSFMKTDLWNEARNNLLLPWVFKQGAIISAFDISDRILTDATSVLKSNNVKATLKRGDIRNIPFEDNSFDYIYSMGTIEHTPQFRKSASELLRVLKPGGKGIIGVPNKYPWFDPLRYYYMKSLDKFGKFPYGFEKHFTQKEFKALLKDVGFEVTEESSIMLFPFALRVFDIFLYRRNKMLCNVNKPLLHIFEYIENQSNFFRDRGGYLIACKVVKKEKR